MQTVYLIEVRRFDTPKEADFEELDVVNIVTDKAMAQAWIAQHGLEWDKKPYYFAVYSMIVNHTESSQPIDELYYFDQYGVEHQSLMEMKREHSIKEKKEGA